MAVTSHGHYIPGSILLPDGPTTNVVRCGGPGLCGVCSAEVTKFTDENVYNEAVKAVKLEGTIGHDLLKPNTKYESRSHDVEARLYTGSPESGFDVYSWGIDRGARLSYLEATPPEYFDDGTRIHDGWANSLMVFMSNGTVEIKPLMWLVKTIDGSFHVLESKLFYALYKIKE